MFDFGFESRLSRHRNFSTGCLNEHIETDFKGSLTAKKSHRLDFRNLFKGGLNLLLGTGFSTH